MKKETLITLFAMIASMMAVEASAYDFEVTNNGVTLCYSFVNNKTALEVSMGKLPSEYSGGYNGSVVIPESVDYNGNSYPVTGIGKYAFGECTSMTSITIPISVINIGEGAFYDCDGLTSVSIPNSVTSVGNHVFSCCSSLASIVVSEGNSNYDSRDGCNAIIETATNMLMAGCKNTVIPSSVTNIARGSFYGCDGLTSVTIPNSVTCIGEAAFYDCSSLTSVTIGNSVATIDYQAFSLCSSLMSVTIPNSVTTIRSEAFHGCTSLVSVTIPSSVTSIGDYAFGYCFNLASMVVSGGNSRYDSRDGCNAIIETATNRLIAGCKNTVIPNSVTSIGENAFAGCTGLVSVTIPNSVTSIELYAFKDCSALTNIVIPNSVANIGWYVFLGCSNLASVTIPNSVTNIGYGAFDGTSWYNNQPDGVVYAGQVAYKYKGTMPSNTSIVIKEGTLGISDFAFCQFSSLTSVTIPNSVTSICSYAFSQCTGLTSVTIPNSITNIGDHAFEKCSNLTSVAVEAETPPTVGDDVFSNYNITLKVPRNSLQNYKSTSPWSKFKSIEALAEYFDLYIGGLQVTRTNAKNLTSVLTEEGILTGGTVDFSASGKAMTLTLNDAKIASENSAAIYNAGGTLNIVVNGECEAKGPNSIRSGFSNKVGSTTTVRGMGSLTFSGRQGVEDSGTLIIDGATLVCNGQSIGYYGLEENSKLIIRNGTLKASVPLSGRGAFETDGQLEMSANAAIVEPKGAYLKDGVILDAQGYEVKNQVVITTATGDANGDGQVDVADIAEIVNYLTATPSEQFNAATADADGNGKVEAADIEVILQRILR